MAFSATPVMKMVPWNNKKETTDQSCFDECLQTYSIRRAEYGDTLPTTPPVSRADVASQKSDHTNQQWEVEVAGAFLEDAGDDYGPLVRDRRLTWPERGLETYYKGRRRLADAHGPP